MSKRRIAFLISDMSAGGAQRVASILCSGWVAGGADVTLITFEPEGTRPFYDLHPDICLKCLGLLGGSGNLLKAVPANVRRIRALRGIYRDIRPDVLITFMPESNILGLLSVIGFRKRIPVLVSERSDPRFIPAQKVWRILRRLTYKRARAVVCQTEGAAAFFSYHPSCIAIANPLPPPEIYAGESGVEPSGPFIAALGRLGYEKGFDILIEAFAQVRQEFPAYHLMIVGEGDQRGALEDLVAALGLAGRVHFPGARKQPFSILQKADVFVLPSRFEGFPNALCEAMACGLPVVASEGAVEALSFFRSGFNGLAFRREDSTDLAGKLRYLLSDSVRAQMLAAEGVRIAGDLSPDKICAQWGDIIEEAVLS